jgi:hypothetical protein
MNRRILIAAAIVAGLVVLSAVVWAPPLLKTARTEPTPTVIPATATAAPPTTHDLDVVVSDAESGDPISNAQVVLGDKQGNTDDTGAYTTALSHGVALSVEVRMPGYEVWKSTVDTTQSMDKELTLHASLTPNTVRGQVVGVDLTPLPEATVIFHEQPVTLDDKGRFTLRRVAAGDEVIATSPGYAKGSAVSDGYSGLYLVLEPLEVVVHVRDAMMGVVVPARRQRRGPGGRARRRACRTPSGIPGHQRDL